MTKIKIAFLSLAMLSIRAGAQNPAPNNLPDSIKKGIEEGRIKLVTVDKSAEYPGGMRQFYLYLSQNLKYPKKAKKNGVKGKVYVEFTIKEDGSIDDSSPRILTAAELGNGMPEAKSEIISDKECEQEAIRLMKECPNWLPARQKDKPVKQTMAVPVFFMF